MFFDRDGCLNEDIGFLHEWDKFRWLPGAIEAVELVNRAGFRAFVVTNQSGVARGLYTGAHVEAIYKHMGQDLARKGAWLDAMRYCPHHPTIGDSGLCRCRKPGPGMVEDLMQAWSIDPARAFMVGDRDTDVGAAQAAGIKGIKIAPGHVLATVERELERIRAQ